MKKLLFLTLLIPMFSFSQSVNRTLSAYDTIKTARIRAHEICRTDSRYNVLIPLLSTGNDTLVTQKDISDFGEDYVLVGDLHGKITTSPYVFSDFFLVSDTAVGGHSRWAPYGATAVIDTTHGYYRDSLNVGRAGAPGYIRLNNGGGKTRLYSSSNPGEDFLFSFPRNNGTGITDGDTVNQRAFSDLRYGQLGAENTWLYTQYGNWQGSLYGNVMASFVGGSWYPVIQGNSADAVLIGDSLGRWDSYIGSNGNYFSMNASGLQSHTTIDFTNYYWQQFPLKSGTLLVDGDTTVNRTASNLYYAPKKTTSDSIAAHLNSLNYELDSLKNHNARISAQMDSMRNNYGATHLENHWLATNYFSSFHFVGATIGVLGASESFAIQTPAYASGMFHVGLSGDGTAAIGDWNGDNNASYIAVDDQAATITYNSQQHIFQGQVLFNNTPSWGSGTLIASIAPSRIYDCGSIAAGVDSTFTIVATGAIAGNPVMVGVTVAAEQGLIITGECVTNDQIRVRLSNHKTSGSIDPASRTYKVYSPIN